MDRRTFMLGGVAGSCGFLTGCDQLIGETYRYRLTAEIETPQGIRSGSGVYEVKTWKGISFPAPEAGGIKRSIRGEAIPIDLPGGRTLFILFDTGERMLLEAYRPNLSGRHELDRIREAKQLDIIASVPRSTVSRIRAFNGQRLYPRFATFENPRIPLSIQSVDPDNLAATFGKGFKLKSSAVQISRDPITTGIIKRLPWLPEYRNKSLSGNLFQKSTFYLPDALSLGSFSTEISHDSK